MGTGEEGWGGGVKLLLLVSSRVSSLFSPKESCLSISHVDSVNSQKVFSSTLVGESMPSRPRSSASKHDGVFSGRGPPSIGAQGRRHTSY